MSLFSNILHDRKIAILAADGFDESQLFSPKKALEDAGAKVVIVSLNKGQIKAWQQDHWGKSIEVDASLSDCSPGEFDALLIPGGENTTNDLYTNKKVSEFVKEFVYDGKSVATSGHSIRILIENNIVKGKTISTWPTLKKDVIKSGAKWKDDETVSHKGLITTRCAGESQNFNRKMIETFAISPIMKKALIQ